nr:DNA topoisomerase 3-alpha isoform X1 [Tanacetum cinerariifolium]
MEMTRMVVRWDGDGCDEGGGEACRLWYGEGGRNPSAMSLSTNTEYPTEYPYDSMSGGVDALKRYELWNPYLCIMMEEEDMEAVRLGTKRKENVLATCLQ